MPKLDAKTIGIATAVLMVVIILIGQTLVYYTDPYHCSANIERNGNNAEYSFDTNLSLGYTAVSIDNKSNVVKKYVAYYDEEYSGCYYISKVKESLEQLQNQMRKNNIDLGIVNNNQLKELMRGSIDTAVIFATGILPDIVYSGHADDLIFQWLSKGGTMYWVSGRVIGSMYFDADKNIHDVADSDHLFFNNTDVVRKENNDAFDRTLIPGSITDVLKLYYNDCTHGIKTSRLTTQYLALDYSVDGYHSVTFVRYHGGSGTICVFGGELVGKYIFVEATHLVSHIIASRITYDSEIIDHHMGDSAKGAHGVLRCKNTPTDVFVFIGDNDVIYGKCKTV